MPQRRCSGLAAGATGGRLRDGLGQRLRRHLLIQECREAVQRAEVPEHLAEGDLHPETLQNPLADLGEQQGVESQVDERILVVGLAVIGAGVTLEQVAQFIDQTVFSGRGGCRG